MDEHDFSEGDISSDDDICDERCKHESKSKDRKNEMIALEIFKMEHTSPYSNFAY